MSGSTAARRPTVVQHCFVAPSASQSASYYILTPDPLITAFVRDPLAVGIWTAIARLAWRARGPVPLAATELAAWAGSVAEPERAAIMRRILKLEASGWLIIDRTPANKHRLLPAWGRAANLAVQPWQFDRSDLGRPDHLRGRRVPTALLDHYLGQFTPQAGRQPALICRYLTHPLLNLADVGTYAIRQRTEVHLSTRLRQLGLADDNGVLPLPSLHSLLARVTAGQVIEGLTIRLTEWGYAELGEALSMGDPISDSRSVGRSHSRSAKKDESQGDVRHPDAEKAVSIEQSDGNAWDGWDESRNQQESPTNNIDAGGGTACHNERDVLPGFPQSLGFPALALQATTCGEIHSLPADLAPLVAAGHQTLNPQRAIFPGEWLELLEIQHAYGEQQLLTWQARAARANRAGVRQISPAYYAACAAQAAVETYRPPRYERAPALLTEPPTDSGLTRPPAPTLDSTCEALLIEMGIRERELLAAIPLALIQQWAGVIDHAGLAARFDDPQGFAHSQLRKQQPPPPRAELDRWAERARTRAAAASPPALTDAQVQAIRERHAAIEARAAALARDDLTDDERMALLADLERGMGDAEALERLYARRAVVPAPPPAPEQICTELLERFRRPIHRALWPLLDRVTFAVEGETLRIVCERVADLGNVEAELAMRIRSALRQYDWQPSVRVVARAVPVPPPEIPPQPPSWIAPERWASLPGLMRTALLGSRLEGEMLCCTAPALTALVRTRFARELAALLEEVHGGN